MTQSTELTGGAGFAFEDAVVAVYLSALLGEYGAPGLVGRTVVRVAVQQAAFGEPLDDLIADGVAADGSTGRLSLQVKRTLRISAATSNSDFREVVVGAYETVFNESFRQDSDRVGVVVGTISDTSKRTLETITEWARASATAEYFIARLSSDGPAGNRHRDILSVFRTILSEERKTVIDDVDIYHLLRHFVIIRFDLMRDSATDESNAIQGLSSALSATDAQRAGELWRSLCRIAAEGSGRAAAFDRRNLLAQLRGGFRFSGARSLKDCLERLTEEASLSLATIPIDVDGFTVGRPGFVGSAESYLKTHTFLQITGLPGVGKSSVLCSMAHRCLSSGPVIVLKADRILGPSWSQYATSIGLGTHLLADLLVEIAAVGSAIIFVDGIDRIDVASRGIVLDIVNAILADPELRKVWRIVATTRDNGIEPLRTWLPAALLLEAGVATLPVLAFDDAEAAALAEAKPALRSLLFGDNRIREIARRPFFASIMARGLSQSFGDRAAPHSEIELADEWWRLGGYRAAAAQISRRQRSLVTLAKIAAKRPGRGIGLGSELDIETIDQLREDGIVRDTRAGHSVHFAHDIFFEWSFLQLLISREDEWLEEIKSAGEPPVLGRPVELLAQNAFMRDATWARQLVHLESAAVRSQWVRSWLLGPLGTSDFVDRTETYTNAIGLEGSQRLMKLLVWFQAEKTRPHPLIIQNHSLGVSLSRSAVIRAADAYAVPSDFMACARLCHWILDRVESLPVEAIPDTVSIFEIWQNGFADMPNLISPLILPVVQNWLEDMEDREHAEGFRFERGRWRELREGTLRELEERLRALLLRAARTDRQRISPYLRRVTERRRLRAHSLQNILTFSSLLAEHHGDEIADLTARELQEPLPADVAKRPRGRSLALPSFSRYDWDHLAIDRRPGFFPPSPLREPFASLLKTAPQTGLRLVRQLSNHAIQAWRQLYSLDPEHRATPIPVRMDLPWGMQQFWGDARVYQWFRGSWGPHAVEAGLMALERWAFSEIERGRSADDVICDVLSGHDSVAVLGIAVMVALTTNHVSAATLPLATSQRLWGWDIQRQVSDLGGPPNLMGFMKPEDVSHAKAVREENQRPARQLEIRLLAQFFVLSGEIDLATKARAAIVAFPDDLPFDYEEQREHGPSAAMRRNAELWAEFGRLDNYSFRRAEKENGFYIELNNPRAAGADVVATVERQEALTKRLELCLWANDCVKIGSVSTKFDLSKAIEQAKRIDNVDLFSQPYEVAQEVGESQSAVASVAMAALCFAVNLADPDLRWATGVVLRAARTTDAESDRFAGRVVLPHHPRLAAARALAGLIRRGVTTDEAKRELIHVAGDPVEQISEVAFGRIFSLWDLDSEFAWVGLELGLKLSIGVTKGADIGAYGYDHESNPGNVERTVADALRELEGENGQTRLTLTAIPPAWVYAAPRPWHDSSVGRKEAASKPIWRSPDVFLRWDFLPKVLKHVPVGAILADELRRDALLDLCDRLVAWTIESLRPSWRSDEGLDDKKQNRTDLIEWRMALYGFLGHVASHLGPEGTKRRFLAPAFALDDELGLSLIVPFVKTLTCTIMDTAVVDTDLVELLLDCVDRVNRHEDLARARWNGGKVYGFDLPEFIRSIFFVAVDGAGGAARFANGKWDDVSVILPIVDRFARSAGDIPLVAESFLTLCERSIEFYPSPLFVEQVLGVLGKQAGMPAGWRETTLLARVAGLVQGFAERRQPLDLPLAQDMLRMLDRLVDLGDRRSAALQTSELFRNIELMGRRAS